LYSTTAYVIPTEKINEFIVGIRAHDGKSTMENEYMVVGDPSNQVVFCRCRQFERVGILCSHDDLKVLDMMNIMLLPHHYVLKRWTQEARSQLYKTQKAKLFWKTQK
jgi:hypothetical protein